jgi:5-oxoprolinase (ATP-hydrolysing) subunit A
MARSNSVNNVGMRAPDGPQQLSVDLNADLGESFGVWQLGDDAGLLEVISSANIACGYHAGDASTMRRTCALAVERGVSIGAQVGYRDLAGFGRRFIDVEPNQLTDEVIHQIAGLGGMARAAGGRVRYVKPHGALYNAIVDHEDQAAAVVEAIRVVDETLPVYGLPGSVWLRCAHEAGLTVVAEAFADRAYTADARLVSRRRPGALLLDPDIITARAVAMVTSGRIEAEDGSLIEVKPQSICVHGDTPGAVSIARAVRTGLQAAGIGVGPVS